MHLQNASKKTAHAQLRTAVPFIAKFVKVTKFKSKEENQTKSLRFKATGQNPIMEKQANIVWTLE